MPLPATALPGPPLRSCDQRPDAVRQEDIHLGTARKIIVSNVADHLRLPCKGRVQEGNDAGPVLVDRDTLEVQTVVAQGQIMLREGKLLVKGSFE